MTDTANLALPCIEGSQAQKHVTHNEALRVLDTLVQLAVLDRDLTAPPGSPAEGQRWIVKTGATGAWSGRANSIAAWQDGAWQFSSPNVGWTTFVIDEGTLLVWNGTAWGDFFSTVTAIQNLALLGIGTTADVTNVLSAKLNCALFAAKTAAEGGSGDLRYTLSKEAAANTLSFLFQDNYSGRAEIGLTGDDDFHFKVSPDGTAWVDALKLNKTTGAATLAASASAAAFVPNGSSLPANGVYLPAANTIGIAANSTQIWTGTSATIAIKPATTSTSTTTGALTVAGGVGISGSLHIGGATAADYGVPWTFVGRVDQNASTYCGLINATVGANAATIFHMIGGTGNSFSAFGLFDGNGAPTGRIQWGSAVSKVNYDCTQHVFRNAAGSSNWMVVDSARIQFPAAATTASAANAFLDNANSNNLLRSTSSLRYKTDVRPLALAEALPVLDLTPIKFKSLAVADDPHRDFEGLAAEEVARHLPSFVNFTADGQPDGVQYDRIAAVALLAVVKDQQARLAALEAHFS